MSSALSFVIIDYVTIAHCNNIKNLGFIFDDKLSLITQVSPSR